MARGRVVSGAARALERRARRMMDWSESRLSQMVQHAADAKDFNFKVWDWAKSAEDELRRRGGRR